MASKSCMCGTSPEQFVKNCGLMGSAPGDSEMVPKMNLDHRCPHHGEKAQPALWGRHKELILRPKWSEWKSLGVEADEGWQLIGDVVPSHSVPIQVIIGTDTDPLKWKWKVLG